MHIPDGYLSPATAGTMYAMTVPVWYVASRKVRQTLTHRTVPALALFAAFSFVLMMFNVPLPGGTTGHAVGGTLLAIIIGPWAAVLGISVVLIIQAFFFGDGGIMALGANCFNMAVVLPLVGYLVYRAIGSGSQINSSRRLVAAVLGSYVAINVAALLTGVELGLQPALFHSANGTPLYNPYGLSKAVPVMLAGHLLVAGPVEALATGLVFAYVRRYQPGLLGEELARKVGGKLWIAWAALGALAFAAPIGLLASGTAYGEWSLEQLKGMGLGFIPSGLQRFEGWWPAPMPGYGWPRMGAAIGYTLSAIVGMGLVVSFSWLLARRLSRKSPASKVQS